MTNYACIFYYDAQTDELFFVDRKTIQLAMIHISESLKESRGPMQNII